MSIKTVEVICRPCSKCKALEQKIKFIVNRIAIENRIKIVYQFTHTKTLDKMQNFSLNASQTPVILVNGEVESAGLINELKLIQKLTRLHKSC